MYYKNGTETEEREMKTSEGVLILCVLATVTLSAETAHKQLNSIDDLKEVDFGGSVPKHSLLLLYWFANQIDINDYQITLSFNPNSDFGSHHYGNYEGLLEPGHYCTIGNLNDEFPGYVRNPPDRQYEGGNRDRIIVRVQSQHAGVYRIDRVYLTQHNRAAQYDPDHTYQISTSLLQQIRRVHVFHSVNANQLDAFRRRWGNHLGCLGRFLFLVQGERIFRPDTTMRLQGQTRYFEQAYHSNYSHHRGNNDICDHLANVCKSLFFILFILCILFILTLVIINSPK